VFLELGILSEGIGESNVAHQNAFSNRKTGHTATECVTWAEQPSYVIHSPNVDLPLKHEDHHAGNL
jgi:hypothetical protein